MQHNERLQHKAEDAQAPSGADLMPPSMLATVGLCTEPIVLAALNALHSSAAPSTQHPVPSTQYPVPSTQYPVPSIIMLSVELEVKR
ncbi:hypothetical protein [Gilvimarinus agarilyticus]|uniref:hypothetical protein n=1 Tax=Gilvimarinus agarilyticus TaxID=679259 RepID=UPI0012F8D6F9|nr:hypothetical protein [Gilvimarinus agarilyticus]